jgi:hypothetical protein
MDMGMGMGMADRAQMPLHKSQRLFWLPLRVRPNKKVPND